MKLRYTGKSIISLLLVLMLSTVTVFANSTIQESSQVWDLPFIEGHIPLSEKFNFPDYSEIDLSTFETRRSFDVYGNMFESFTYEAEIALYVEIMRI